MRWLALSFLVVPLVELWLLFQVSGLMGLGPTIAFVVGTAFLGAYLAKREGLRVLQSWRRALGEMRLPEEGVTSGLLVLVGAVLLVSPGVLTDFVGLLLMLPPVRRLVTPLLERRLLAYFAARSAHFQVHVATSDYAPRRARVVDVDGQLLDER